MLVSNNVTYKTRQHHTPTSYHTERGDTASSCLSETPNNLHHLLRPDQQAAQLPKGSI